MLNRLIRSDFFKGGLIFTSASFLVSVLSYLFNLLIARFFSLESYGEYMASVSYVMFFSVPVQAVGVILVKRIGATAFAHRASFVKLLETWLMRYVKKYAVWFLVLTGLGSYLLATKANLTLASVVLIVMMTWFTFATIVYTAALQAFKDFKAAGMLISGGALLKILGGVVVILAFPSLGAMYTVMVLSVAAVFFFSRKVVGTLIKTPSALLHQLTHPWGYLQKKSVLVPFLATLGLTGMVYVDVMLVKKFFSGSEAGLYAGLSLLGKIILYFATPLSTVAYSFFTGSDSKHQARKILALTTVILCVVGFSAGMVYALFPQFVVNVVFGGKFSSISSLVWMTAIYGTVYALANLYGQYFISQGKTLSLLTLVAMMGQTLGIIMYHQNFLQVLMAGTMASGFLVVVFGVLVGWEFLVQRS